MLRQRLLSIIENFQTKQVLVVGDVIADEYIIGTTSRISREAPVLILEFESRQVFLGGAANAANNVSACGASTWLAGVVGSDDYATTVRQLLNRSSIEGEALVEADGARTAVKTRILAGGRHTTRQQIVRVDKCPRIELSSKTHSLLLSKMAARAEKADAIIISDYGYGVISAEVAQLLIETAKRREIPITVDARYDILNYKGVTAQTPNETEIEEILGLQLQADEERLIQTGKDLRKRLSLEALLVTRGSKGMMLFTENGHKSIPVFGTDQVADVTGAGDTVIGVFTLALCSGASFEEAAVLANIAGGIVVMKRGTATLSAEELASAVRMTD